MDSPKISPRESWMQCRRSFEERLAHSPLFTIPLQVIDWATTRGVTDWLYASLSHDWLDDRFTSSPPVKVFSDGKGVADQEGVERAAGRGQTRLGLAVAGGGFG